MVYDADMDWPAWEARFGRFLEPRLPSGDPGHDLTHVARVVATAKRLATAEGARLEVVVPAAWLHDCVLFAKDSPERSRASVAAAQAAAEFLAESGYPAAWIPAVRHAIEAHSFSAAIVSTTLEAEVVQDADRLDALGAVGVARLFLAGGVMGRPLYPLDEPFPIRRAADDERFVLDHFFVKLEQIAATMRTATGRAEARRRWQFMERYLEELRGEVTIS